MSGDCWASISERVTRRRRAESSGEVVGALGLRQRTHWRSAPWKSQPPQFVARICGC